MLNIDWTMKHYIFDHGGRIAKDGKIVFTKKNFDALQYTDRSIHDYSIHTMMLPTDFGNCLILEHKHFEIEDHYLDYGA